MNGNNKKYQLNKKAFTLIEVLVAVSIFSLVMVSAMSIFNLILKSQRESISRQNLDENIRYVFELISREMRMAKKDGLDGNMCWPETNNIVYYVASTGDSVYFRNSANECIKYYLEQDGVANRLKIQRFAVGSPIGSEKAYFVTPRDIDVTGLRFLADNSSGTQPIAVLNIKFKVLRDNSNKEMVMQTSISSRYYE